MSAQQLPTVCPDVYNIGNYSGSEFASYTVSSNGEGKNKKYELKDEKSECIAWRNENSSVNSNGLQFTNYKATKTEQSINIQFTDDGPKYTYKFVDKRDTELYELQSDNLLKNGYTTFENGLNVDISKTNKESEGLIGTARKYIRKVFNVKGNAKTQCSLAHKSRSI